MNLESKRKKAQAILKRENKSLYKDEYQIDYKVYDDGRIESCKFGKSKFLKPK